MTDASKEAQITQITQKVVLDRVFCIHYQVQFRKNKKATIQALINSSSKINTMILAYASKLGLKVQKTDIRVQKIDNSSLETYKIVIAAFQVLDKLGRACFFYEIFLLANISMNVVLRILFLTLNNANI